MGKQITAFGMGPFHLHYLKSAVVGPTKLLAGEEVEGGGIRIISSDQKTTLLEQDGKKGPVSLEAKGGLFSLSIPLEGKEVTYLMTPELELLAFEEAPESKSPNTNAPEQAPSDRKSVV